MAGHASSIRRVRRRSAGVRRPGLARRAAGGAGGTPVGVPGWRGGARWFRCDVFVLGADSSANGTNDAIMRQTGSLRDALKGRSPLAHTCYDLDDWYELHPVACARPHRYEYVGAPGAGSWSTCPQATRSAPARCTGCRRSRAGRAGTAGCAATSGRAGPAITRSVRGSGARALGIA
ncbi:septum formation family protein [Micromonospora citrea]|uniref:septum formation family protein n=1 Tax=Micromonospora citrea TaxID=47855 RepID=UPI003C5BF66D